MQSKYRGNKAGLKFKYENKLLFREKMEALRNMKLVDDLCSLSRDYWHKKCTKKTVQFQPIWIFLRQSSIWVNCSLKQIYVISREATFSQISVTLGFTFWEPIFFLRTYYAAKIRPFLIQNRHFTSINYSSDYR